MEREERWRKAWRKSGEKARATMAETGPSVLEAARAATREVAWSERRETAGSGVGSVVGEGMVRDDGNGG